MTNEEWAVYRVNFDPDTHKQTVNLIVKGPEEVMVARAEEYRAEEPDAPSYTYQAGPFRAAYKERAEHGVGHDPYLRGNIHHLLNPIIGMLALDIRDGSVPTEGQMKYFVSRLEAAIALTDEAEGKYNPRRRAAHDD